MPSLHVRERTLPRSRTCAVLSAVLAAALGLAPAALADSGSGGARAPSGDGAPGAAPSALPAPQKQGARRRLGLSRDRVRGVQRQLGLPADGVLGRRTRTALRRYQAAHGLPRTGRVTSETLRSLDEDAQSRATTPASAPRAEAIVAAAREHIGASYRMGATGPSAYDCSGLTVDAFASAGIHLARTSFDQFKQGVAVPRDEIQPGDLVFFDTDGAGASHVGIATSDATVISATSSRGVVEHVIDDDYWGAHYVGARRVAS